MQIEYHCDICEVGLNGSEICEHEGNLICFKCFDKAMKEEGQTCGNCGNNEDWSFAADDDGELSGVDICKIDDHCVMDHMKCKYIPTKWKKKEVRGEFER